MNQDKEWEPPHPTIIQLPFTQEFEPHEPKAEILPKAYTSSINKEPNLGNNL